MVKYFNHTFVNKLDIAMLKTFTVMKKLDTHNPLRKAYDNKPTLQQLHFKNQWLFVFGLSPRSFYKHINSFEADTVALFEFVFDCQIDSTKHIADKYNFYGKACKFKISEEEVNAKIDEFLNAPYHS